MCRRNTALTDTLVKTGECYLSTCVVRCGINDVFRPLSKGEDNGELNRVQRSHLLSVRRSMRNSQNI